MGFRIESKHLGEVVVLVPGVYEDDRGWFMESFRADRFKELGLPSEYVQDNHSLSVKGVVRGLHFQWDPPMGKLMRVSVGNAFVVAVDIRKGSPTIGQWFGLELSSGNKKQVWAPAGFARGFCALSDTVELQYKCTGVHNPLGESSIHVFDPAIGIRWPELGEFKLSEKDRNAQTLANWLASPNSDRFKY
ncbi:MAG TPA: dTDP-4-dehydrorhamnose 3,5-epimerase [Terriglobia bacterium]|nr:dTDP-4-dehydrorhamnose 3,5-epimerase [Terriglobia bacterium]